ncbi:hypothetical protein PTKIN_Ptkin03bG0240700 [Pterospermum kingtungense]
MGEVASQIFGDTSLKKMGSYEARWSNLVIMEGAGGDDDNERCDSVSIESTIEENSENSISSSISASDLVDDDATSSNGPLCELSQLVAQLPIRRGLSKHYQGKSQSFTSLASVRSVEDLPKKVIPLYNNRGKMRSCKRWGLDGDHNQNSNNKSYSPKATISKKAGSRGCFMLSSIGD